MKKYLVILFLFAAQATMAQKVSVGLKAGVNISNFTGGNFEDVEKNSLVGFHGGGWLNIGISAFSIQPELLFSTAGAKFEDAGNSENIRLTYLAVPVMAKYRTIGGLYFEIGPQFSFKLGEDIGDMTIDEFAKNLDLSAAFGLGLQTKSGLGLGARYLAGLSKVGDFNISEGIDPDFKNSVVQIGLSIPLTK